MDDQEDDDDDDGVDLRGSGTHEGAGLEKDPSDKHQQWITLLMMRMRMVTVRNDNNGDADELGILPRLLNNSVDDNMERGSLGIRLIMRTIIEADDCAHLPSLTKWPTRTRLTL